MLFSLIYGGSLLELIGFEFMISVNGATGDDYSKQSVVTNAKVDDAPVDESTVNGTKHDEFLSLSFLWQAVEEEVAEQRF